MAISIAFSCTLVAIQLVSKASFNAVAAAKCYSCSGYSADAHCGTPFSESGLSTCDGESCTVFRSRVDIHGECASWSVKDDASYRGGQLNDALNLHACLDACYFTQSCIGVDWDSSNDAGRNCRLQTVRRSPADAQQSTGVTHLDLVRSPSCPPCLPQWVSIVNLQYVGGDPNVATTLEDCQDACVKSPSCVGVDWTPDEVPTRKHCYLLQQKVYYGIFALSSGVVHYDLTRTAQCDGGYETIARGCSKSAWSSASPDCHRSHGGGDGLECRCSADLCNGNDDEMITDEYIASFGRRQQTAGRDKGSALAYKASMHRRPRLRRLDVLRRQRNSWRDRRGKSNVLQDVSMTSISTARVDVVAVGVVSVFFVVAANAK